MATQETNQKELIFQVKNMLGLTAMMLDNMPQYVQFHFCRVAAKLSTALCAVLGTDDLKVNEVQNIAMKDVLKDWQEDEDIPEGLRNVVQELLAHLEGLPEEEDTEEDTEAENTEADTPLDLNLWNIWGDENPLD